MTYSILGKDENGQTIQVDQGARREGMYIIGASGTGKSTLIQSLVLQDIEQGLGVTLLDPHGDLTNRILETMTARIEDVILLDVAQADQFPFGLNLFSCPYPNDIRWVQYTVNQVMHIFDRLYNITRQTPNMSYFLRNCAYTIIANPGYTMAEIPLLLTDKAFRARLVSHVTDSQVLLFWSDYEQIIRTNWGYHQTILPIRNKLDEFLQPMLRNIVGQSKSTIDLRKIMDERKILFVKLDPRLEDMTTLIGSTIVSLVLNAAYSRGELLEKKRRQMNLYCDEYEWFQGEDFMQLFSEARKFGIGTTVSNQTLSQIEDPIKENILQAATLVVFRVSGQDGEELATEFSAVPPPAETRREAVLIPKQDVLNHLLQHGHSNTQTTEFITTYLYKLVEASQESVMHRQDPRVSYLPPSWPSVWFKGTGYYAYQPQEIKKHLNTLNHLLYLYNSPGRRPSNKDNPYENPNELRSLDREIYKAFAGVLGFYHYAKVHFEPETTKAKQAVAQLREIEKAEYFVVNAPEEKTTLSNNIQPDQDTSFKQWEDLQEQRKQCEEVLKHEGLNLIMETLRQIKNWWEATYVSKDSWFSTEYRHHFYPPYEVPEKDIYMVAQIIYSEEEDRFKKFWHMLVTASTGIVLNNILTESGKFEDKPLAPRPIADVEKEVAKFLSSPLKLPNLTAYIKTPTGEHKVSISRSAGGMSRMSLNQRIADILVANFHAGYVRPVALVMKEITARQSISAPQPIQKPPVQPMDKKSERYSYLEPAEGGSTWEDPSALEESPITSVLSPQKPIQAPSPPPQSPPLPPSRRRKPK